MQYHLNGFRPGNLQIPDVAREPQPPEPINSLPRQVDVLIIGCGPAGLTLARQLAEFSDISTCIVEAKSGPMLFGQADGISCRTMEILEAFNCSEILAKEAYQLHQNAFWEPDPEKPTRIKRTHKVRDARLGLSEFTHCVVNQSRLHDLLLEGMKQSVTHLTPHYSRRLTDLRVDTSLTSDLNAYPAEALFEPSTTAAIDQQNNSLSNHVGHPQTGPEKVRARFIVGCDGGKSTVRKLLNIAMKGDSANKVWGVMDVLPITDFPDIRVKTFIQSQDNGALMIVPREGGYLVRLYVELDNLPQGQRASSLGITAEHLIARAEKVLSPYVLEVKEVAWWSVYEVGQRIAEEFDFPSSSTGVTNIPRAFVAGDACHTHSPKGGWGLNTSLPDTFNLGWKLASVILGRAKPALLKTYATERRRVAQQLLDADRQMAQLVAAKTHAETAEANDRSRSNPRTANTGEIEQFIAQKNGFIAGTSIQYGTSVICGPATYQHLAHGFPIGQRFHSVVATRLADGCPIHLGHLNKADGRWRIFIFGDRHPPTTPASGCYELFQFLATEASPILRYTPANADIDSVIDLCGVFQQTDLELTTLPMQLWPAKGKYGLRDYEKIYGADLEHPVFEARGIDRQAGCMVIVRPDQHVANVLPLTATDELSEFFEGIFYD